MSNIVLVTWSWKIIHLFIKEEIRLASGDIIPVGVICGRKPSKQALRMYRNGMLTVPFGDTQRYGYTAFCKNCHRKISKDALNLFSDKMGLPIGHPITGKDEK